jgi:hypothetical protein
MPNFLFDVKAFSSVRIDAETEAKAREILAEAECGDLQIVYTNSLGISVVLQGEVSLDGDADLMQIDGEAV